VVPNIYIVFYIISFNIQVVDIVICQHTTYCIQKMDCPYCSHPNSRVTNKRNAPIGVRVHGHSENWRDGIRGEEAGVGNPF